MRRYRKRDDYRSFDEVAWYRSVRYTVAMMTFLGFLNVYALRVNLSVAIVKMADEYGWSSARKGNVLSSFFYGYILTQIPGGWFATHYGAKKVFGYGVLMTAILTLFTPVVADNYSLLIALRVLEGFGEVCSCCCCCCCCCTLTHTTHTGCHLPRHSCAVVALGAQQ